MTRKRILNISESNDILKWKKTYNKKPKPFKILSSKLPVKSRIIPNEFLSKEYQTILNFQIKEDPDFSVKILKDKNEIIIELKDYNVPFINSISDKVKQKISSFLDLIDYWSIDFDRIQDKIFKNTWISYRTPKKRSMKVKSEPYLYENPGHYNLSIKTIDIFGIETIKSYQVKI